MLKWYNFIFRVFYYNSLTGIFTQIDFQPDFPLFFVFSSIGLFEFYHESVKMRIWTAL